MIRTINHGVDVKSVISTLLDDRKDFDPFSMSLSRRAKNHPVQTIGEMSDIG